MKPRSLKTVHLVPGRDKSLRHRHPWIFRGAIARVEGDPESGETVRVVSSVGTELGRGAYSPRSQIAVRLWTFERDVEIDAGFIHDRMKDALGRREPLVRRGDFDGVRLVHAESDGLPGLHVDRYGEFVVVQFLAAGVEKWRTEIAQSLAELAAPRGIYERSDVDVREKEGLAPRCGVLHGEEPPAFVEIREGESRYLVDVRLGHKTGFYLDQRENRRLLRELTSGREVLNAFAYTGGFAVPALHGGASRVTNLDSSAAMLEICAKNMEQNGFGSERFEQTTGDAFKVLRAYRDAGRTFDVIILDPPKFAESKVHVETAARGYKDINLLAFKLLRPRGKLATFSCSGLLPTELFQKIVADAALDARRVGRIERRLFQGPDHPIALDFPEGSYLKGLLVDVE